MPKLPDTPLVDFDAGYISSDSDFYGDPPIRHHLHLTARAYHPLPTHLPTSTLATSLPSPTALALATPTPPPQTQNQKPYNPYQDNPSAKQLSEPLSTFLHRLPPSRTPRSLHGDWLWIANPYSPRRAAPDHARLTSHGAAMIAAFEAKRSAVEADMAAKAKATITRAVNPLRGALREGLLALARECGEVSGKWMLFPAAADVDGVWARVCEGVLEGRLGVAAKVGTVDDVGVEGAGGREGVRLVCVYTADFGERGDVRRVVGGLREMGLVGEGGVWYKCDAFTHLGIDASNPWGLKASLYSSKEALAWDV